MNVRNKFQHFLTKVSHYIFENTNNSNKVFRLTRVGNARNGHHSFFKAVIQREVF